MIRLDLVVPGDYRQDYNRKYAAYEKKLQERARRIKADQEAREAESPSTSTSPLPYPLTTSRYPYPSPPPEPQIMFLAYGTAIAQLLDVIDGLLALLPYKPERPLTNDLVLQLARRARKKMRGRRPGSRAVLQQLLDDGQMIYRVRPDGHGLERRVNPVAHAQAIAAADAADQAGCPAASARRLEA